MLGVTTSDRRRRGRGLVKISHVFVLSGCLLTGGLIFATHSVLRLPADGSGVGQGPLSSLRQPAEMPSVSKQQWQQEMKLDIFPHITHAYRDPDKYFAHDRDAGGDRRTPTESENKKKVVAYAITVTRDGDEPYLDGAAILAQSVNDICRDSIYLCDLVALVHPTLAPKSAAVLSFLGYRVLLVDTPVPLDDIRDEETRRRVQRGGCCGVDENIKFHAFSLVEYHRVLHLDTDSLLLRTHDELFELDYDLVYTADVNMMNAQVPCKVPPVQGGFLLLRPDEGVLDDFKDILRNTPFRRGWGDSLIGLFYGGITVQGLLPYYYHTFHPQQWLEADRCKYNTMVDSETCKAVPLGEIKGAHFTVCEKPWKCIHPHPRLPLCTALASEWFMKRAALEKKLGAAATMQLAGAGPGGGEGAANGQTKASVHALLHRVRASGMFFPKPASHGGIGDGLDRPAQDAKLSLSIAPVFCPRGRGSYAPVEWDALVRTSTKR